MSAFTEFAALTGAFMLQGAGFQPACYADDLQCRVNQLEARVAELEQRVSRRAQRGTPMAANRPCGVYACELVARDICVNAGFARGVALEIDQGGAHGGRITRVECFD